MIYFDNHATTCMAPEAISEMSQYCELHYGNPSSTHLLGQLAAEKILEVKSLVSKKLKCSPEEIIFTSGGTESNNLCIKGFAYKNQQMGKHIITTKIEHPSVLNCCSDLKKHGFETTYLDVSPEGFVNPYELKKAIRKDTILVTIAHVNHEIGTIQPLEELVNAAGNIAFHTDVVQSFLKTDFNISNYPVSMASFSGHKVHAPKGIGFIYKIRTLIYVG